MTDAASGDASLSIRSARIDDAPVLAALMTVLGSPTEAASMSSGLNRVLSDLTFCTLVAEAADKKVVGFGGFRCTPRRWACARAGHAGVSLLAEYSPFTSRAINSAGGHSRRWRQN